MTWPTEEANFHTINSDKVIELFGNNRLEDAFYNYALKFRRAGFILTEHLFSKHDNAKMDTYFFSIAFLYRHSIELALKAIGFKYITEEEERKEFLKDTSHNLSKLLEAVVPHLNNLIVDNQPVYSWLKQYFVDIDLIDRESDSFRYPFLISVNKIQYMFETIKEYSVLAIFDKQTHIDLVKFVKKFETALEILGSYYKEEIYQGNNILILEPVFIEEGGRYINQSVVGNPYNPTEFYPYVKAYTNSARYLYKAILNNRQLGNYLFIPMCYMYRNSVELALKEILFEESSLPSQQSLKHIRKKKHKVLGLWNLIKHEIMEHANAPSDDKTIENVERYIIQLNNIDSSSDKFRYPTNKHLKLHFSKGEKFDIDNVNIFFAQLLSFLSSVEAIMSVHNEWKAEMEADYRAEMEEMYRTEMSGYNEYY